MTKPCILDIKLGSVPYNPKKIERQLWKSNSTTSAEHKFRLCGLSYYENDQTSELSLINKYRCRAMKTEQMREEMKKFFCPGTEARPEVANFIIDEL